MVVLPWIFVGVIGLICGSFGNVLLHRVHTGESFRGRSHCPWCRSTIHWHDLIPVGSYLWLRGACRQCRKPISPRYPLIELGSAALFLLAWWMTPTQPFIALLQAIVLESLFLGALYDAFHEQLPDLFTWPIAIIGTIFLLLHGDVISAFKGAAIPLLWFGLQWILSRGRIVGSGDIFLGTAVGWWLGFPRAILFLLSSYIVGAMVILLLLAFRILSWKQRRIAFGPFLAIGGLCAFLGLGERLIWFVQ